MPNNTQQLVVYIEAEDYRRLKLLGSNSRGMSKIVRALIKGYLNKVQAKDIPQDLLESLDEPGSP